jgi:hypothetical protein
VLPLHDEADDDLPRYRQKPRPIGFEIAYAIEGDTLVVNATRSVSRIPLKAVEEVRFLFKPGNIAATGYLVRLTIKDGRRITIGDTSWRSLVEVERGGARYVRFVEALVRGVAEANPQARFVAGKPPAIWAVYAAVGVVAVGFMLLFAWRALNTEATGAAVLVLGLFAVALMQLYPLIRLNRPRRLALGEIPADLMPASGS